MNISGPANTFKSDYLEFTIKFAEILFLKMRKYGDTFFKALTFIAFIPDNQINKTNTKT